MKAPDTCLEIFSIPVSKVLLPSGFGAAMAKLWRFIG
jgi:hypothetical protein